MFFACGIWCLADVSSVSPSSEQTYSISTFFDLKHLKVRVVHTERSIVERFSFQVSPVHEKFDVSIGPIKKR